MVQVGRGSLCSTLVLAMSIVWSGSACAQTAVTSGTVSSDAQKSPLTEDIIVTARRQEERLQNVPVAITALSGKFLENHSVQNLTELANYVPGLKVETFSSPDQYIVSFRGQRTSLVLPGVDPAVGLYINEVPYALAMGAAQQFYDLESIQALKGPQGTLFGQSTTGGAVLFTTTKPKDTFGGSVTLGGKLFNGNHGLYGTAVINAPLSEKIAIRAAVNGIDREGYVLNKGPFPPVMSVPGYRPNKRSAGDLNDEHQFNARLSLLLKPADGIENLTIGTYGKLRSNAAGQHWTAYNPISFIGFVYGSMGVDPQVYFNQAQAQQKKNFWSTFSPIDSFWHVKTYGLTNITDIEVADGLKLRNVANYREFHRFGDEDLRV